MKPENPFAFPQPDNWEHGGMTLRDYFAAKALEGTLSDGRNLEAILEQIEKTKTATADNLRSTIAFTCYQLADAMLAERERTQ